jgi:hypothetical protein
MAGKLDIQSRVLRSYPLPFAGITRIRFIGLDVFLSAGAPLAIVFL